MPTRRMPRGCRLVTNMLDALPLPPTCTPGINIHLQPLENLRPREGTVTVTGPDLDTRPWETAIDWAKDLSRRYEFRSLETADWVGRDTATGHEASPLPSGWSCRVAAWGAACKQDKPDYPGPVCGGLQTQGRAVWESSRTRQRCLTALCNVSIGFPIIPFKVNKPEWVSALCNQ